MIVISMPGSVQVALPIPTKSLFGYNLPEAFDVGSMPGRRVLVPLGRRKLTGVIVEYSSEYIKGYKEVEELLDWQPSVDEAMLKLTKWMADYYICSWGEAIRAALPQGMARDSVFRITLNAPVSDSEIDKMAQRAPKRAEVLRLINDSHDNISAAWLERKTGVKNIIAHLEYLQQMGLISCQRIVDEFVKEKTVLGCELPQSLLQDHKGFNDILSGLEKKAPMQFKFLTNLFYEQLRKKEPIPISEIAKLSGANAQTARALEKKGLVEISDIAISRCLSDDGPGLAHRDESKLDLTAEQRICSGEIIESMDAPGFKAFLMHGVTGSGKTLVYMKAILHALKQGKSALLMVPEISLTPQLIDRFRLAFEEPVAILHSRMSQGERYDEWRSIRSGKARIVIGARSAIFAPLQDLGLIIVDEEHEPSYKQISPQPRYNGRDAAVVRASIEGITIVLGSATPSLESMYNARTDKYTLLEIRHRADGAVLPETAVVDLVNARASRNIDHGFSRLLLDEIQKCIENKEGVILFHNRRGYSVLLQCPECGYVPQCKNCAVSLTYHKEKAQLRCHYCGYTINSMQKCPECGHPHLEIMGTGTQRIEEDLVDILKNRGLKAVVERMDLDTTSKKGSHRRLLQAFANGEIDVLIGTQMVAKGLDISRVTLVGVVNADRQMMIPDFRSAERTYQLLTQVSGRAGRSSDKPGKVIIQSWNPGNIAITASVRNDYDLFYNSEIEQRKKIKYPPFTRFVMIEFYGPDRERVNRQATIFHKIIRGAGAQAVEILGPVEPNIARIRGQFRMIIVLKNIKGFDMGGSRLRQLLNYAVDKYNKEFFTTTVKMTVDIDSYSAL